MANLGAILAGLIKNTTAGAVPQGDDDTEVKPPPVNYITPDDTQPPPIDFSNPASGRGNDARGVVDPGTLANAGTASTVQQTDNPYQDRMSQALADYTKAQNLKPQDLDKHKDKWYVNLGKGALNALAANAQNIQEVSQRPGRNTLGATLGTILGTAAGGGVYNVADPYADEKLRIEQKKKEALQNLTTAQGLYDNQQTANLKQAQADYYGDRGSNLATVNAFNEKKLAATIAGRDDRVKGKMVDSLIKIINRPGFTAKDNPTVVSSFEKLTGITPTDNTGKVKTTYERDAETGALLRHSVDELGNETNVEHLVGKDGKPVYVTQPAEVAAKATTANNIRTTTASMTENDRRIAAQMKLETLKLGQDQQDKIRQDITTQKNNLRNSITERIKSGDLPANTDIEQQLQDFEDKYYAKLGAAKGLQ